MFATWNRKRLMHEILTIIQIEFLHFLLENPGSLCVPCGTVRILFCLSIDGWLFDHHQHHRVCLSNNNKTSFRYMFRLVVCLQAEWLYGTYVYIIHVKQSCSCVAHVYDEWKFMQNTTILHEAKKNRQERPFWYILSINELGIDVGPRAHSTSSIRNMQILFMVVNYGRKMLLCKYFDITSII